MEDFKSLFREPVELVCVVLITIMSFSVVLGVMDRFVIHAGLAWTAETARYSMVWTCFLSAAFVTKKKGHFVVNLIVPKLPALPALFWTIIIQLVSVVISVLIVIKGAEFAIKVGNLQRSPVLGLSMFYVYLSVPVSFTLMAYYIGRQTIDTLSRKGS